MLEAAIDYYHDLLDDAARETAALLEAEQRARNLFFGARPLVTVLRPHLIGADQYAQLQQACGLVAAASQRLALAMLAEPQLRAQIALTPAEEALVLMHPGYSEPSAHSRMDTFLTLDGSSLQFVEYNAESPAAIAYEDALSELFLELPIMQQFGQRYRVSALPARQHLLDTLLSAWREFGGAAPPSIAIVDWAGLPTRPEFELFQSYFHAHGLAAIICTPDDLRYQGGELFAELDGRRVPITLVYKRVLTSEFLMRYGDAALEHPLCLAYRDAKVCMVNSFRAKLLHKKALFALLTDEALQPHFSAPELAAIAQHVPWTRMLREGAATYQGEAIDLLAFARSNQERLLLKPNDEYGGKGIVIGWEVSADAWAGALRDALATPSVIQERVTIAYEPYPALVNGRLEIGQRLVDSDPFLFGNTVSGCLSRLSTVTLLNVTAGGGSTVPTFVLDAPAS